MPISGKLIEPNILVPTYAIKRILTDAEIAALNTTPQVVVPAVPGHSIVPIFGHLFRPLGTAWTAGAMTAISLTLAPGLAYIWCNSFDAAVMTSGTTNAVIMGPRSPTVGGSAYSGVAGVGPTGVGFPLNVKAEGGNPTNGTGGLEVTVVYNLIPTRFGNIS